MKKYIEISKDIFNKSTFLGVLFFLSLSMSSQVNNLPDLSKLKTYSDFHKVDRVAYDVLKWLATENSFSDQTNRKKAIDFIDLYAQKSGYIVYNPSNSLVKFKKNSEYNTQFKVGWILFVLNYEYSRNTTLNHYQAFNHLIDFYVKHKSEFGKNSYLEKLKKMKENKELKKFIESNI